MKCKYCKEFLYPQCAEPSSHMEDENVCEYFDDRQFNFQEWLKDNSKDYTIELCYSKMFIAKMINKKGNYTVIAGETLLRIAEKFNNQFKG